MNLNFKSPLAIVLSIILITIMIVYFLNSIDHSEDLKELAEQKGEIDKKIEELDKQKKWIDITKDGDLIGRNYFDEVVLLATDKLDEMGKIYEREYYKDGYKFAIEVYYARSTAIKYYDCDDNIINEYIIPPQPPIFPVTG